MAALLFGFDAFTAKAMADDPRCGRMISILERLDERLSRLEDRVAMGQGSYRQSMPSPASYRRVDDQYQTYFRQGWNDAQRGYGYQPVSYQSSAPIRYASYSQDADYSVPVSYGGGQVITIRLVIVAPGSDY
jgi:hypothetical protein